LCFGFFGIQVAAKSNPDMAGLGTGATNVTDACLTRCGLPFACSSFATALF
jgi:hypothetical protein